MKALSFYFHERLGLDGQNIRMWKLGAMFKNAVVRDALAGFGIASQNDYGERAEAIA